MIPALDTMNGLVRVFVGGINNKTKQTIYKNGFFFVTGIVSGVVLNDIFILLNLPSGPIIVSTPDGPNTTGLRVDELWQNGIATMILAAGILLNKSELMSIAVGQYLGIQLANKSERGLYIGAT